PVLRRRLPGHKNWSARAYANQLFALPPPARPRGAVFRREKARPEDSLLRAPGIPEAAWSPDHLRKFRRRSTDTVRGCAQETPATHMTWVTSACPERGFPRMPVDMRLPNHRANHRVVGTDVRWEDPMAS